MFPIQFSETDKLERKVVMSKNEISTANNVINIINTARENALRRVNEELISMYCNTTRSNHCRRIGKVKRIKCQADRSLRLRDILKFVKEKMI